MAIKINGKDLAKRIINGQEVEKVMCNWVQIRPDVPMFDDYLYFEANEINSKVTLNKSGSPANIQLEYSRDKSTWYDYVFWDELNLLNVWDRVYFRNKSNSETWFTSSTLNYYRFSMSGTIYAGWDITSLLCISGSSEINSNYCFWGLFNWCSALHYPPKLPATKLAPHCYTFMFPYSWLIALPELPTINLARECYRYMFQWCSWIKMSTTQTWEYQTPYRIPSSWTWVIASNALNRMFDGTWWTFTGTPTINTTYYTSNTIIS